MLPPRAVAYLDLQASTVMRTLLPVYSDAVRVSPNQRGYSRVMHIQSPSLTKTDVLHLAGLATARVERVLGLKHPWIHYVDPGPLS